MNPTAMTTEEDDGAHPVIRFRDLPGIAEIEALLADAVRLRGRNWQWCDEHDRATALAEQASRRLFGITVAETRYVDDPDLSRDANDHEGGWWDSRFDGYEASGGPGPTADWADIDWDVTGGDGRPLRALGFFYRQIVAVEFGLCGHLPGEDAELSAAEADGIAARLQAEAAKFKRR